MSAQSYDAQSDNQKGIFYKRYLFLCINMSTDRVNILSLSRNSRIIEPACPHGFIIARIMPHFVILHYVIACNATLGLVAAS